MAHYQESHECKPVDVSKANKLGVAGIIPEYPFPTAYKAASCQRNL